MDKIEWCAGSGPNWSTWWEGMATVKQMALPNNPITYPSIALTLTGVYYTNNGGFRPFGEHRKSSKLTWSRPQQPFSIVSSFSTSMPILQKNVLEFADATKVETLSKAHSIIQMVWWYCTNENWMRRTEMSWWLHCPSHEVCSAMHKANS